MQKSSHSGYLDYKKERKERVRRRCMQRSWDKLNCNMREIITISDTQLQLEIYLQIVKIKTCTDEAIRGQRTKDSAAVQYKTTAEINQQNINQFTQKSRQIHLPKFISTD